MYFSAHEFSQRAINHLMALQWSFASKINADNDGLEVRIVVTENLNLTIRHTGSDELFYFSRSHLESLSLRMAAHTIGKAVHLEQLAQPIVYH
jgi:hypothetical protein